MPTQLGKQVKRAFNVLFVLLILTGSVGVNPSPVQAAQVDDAPGLLQFTSGGHALGFTSRGMYAVTGTHALRVDFARANPVKPQADSAPGADGKAAPLGRVTYADLWDGVTLTYSATTNSIYTTTYSLAPGANPADIRLHYNAPLRLNDDGTLRIAFETGALTESAPVAWQEILGKRVPVNVAFRVDGQAVTFALGAYDRHHALSIDPSLTWNTFLGGSGSYELAAGVALDGSGNVYVAGYGNATWGSPVRAYTGGDDAFAAKLDSSGNLVWNTFLGGSWNDVGLSIAVGGDGNVYVAGSSHDSWGSPVQVFGGSFDYADAFASKLDSSGNLIWNTFTGVTTGTVGFGIGVDGSGNVYLAGTANTTWGSPARAYSGQQDIFVAKLNSSGYRAWHTFLGGSGPDTPSFGIAVDGSGNVYVAGYGSTTWGNPVRAYTGSSDAFAARLDSSGALTWNTFLGGSGSDEGRGVAVDGSGNVYITGASDATWGGPVRAYTGSSDAFAARLDSSGALTWNTFLGGSDEDSGVGITVDPSGKVYVAGSSDATWGSPARTFTGCASIDCPDAFAAGLDSSGSLTWNTFLGGSDDDFGYGIAVDSSGNIFVAGQSDASWGTPVNPHAGYGDVFVAKVPALSPWTIMLYLDGDNCNSPSFSCLDPHLQSCLQPA